MVLFSRLKLLQVIFHVQNLGTSVCCIDECRHYAIAIPDIRRDLAALRLVNRKQSQGTIAFIDFSLVRLNSGTWQQIFMELCTFQHLLDFYIQHSGYSLAGSSSGLAAIMLPDPKCLLSVESENPLDTNALGNLQRQVNANRISAGFPPCPERDYRYINFPPLETEMRYLRHLEHRV